MKVDSEDLKSTKFERFCSFFKSTGECVLSVKKTD